MLSQESIKVDFNVPAKMKDGITLYADVYRPNTESKFPAILTRLPYGKNGSITGGFMNPHRIASAGYNVVIQDIRGTGASEGEFYPRRAEMKDGYDTVEWIAAQPWCNGNVGMYGMSHMGFTQWAAAVMQPPHLKTICPTATKAGARPYDGGALALNHLLAWAAQFPGNKLGRSKLPPEKLKMLRNEYYNLKNKLEDQYWQLPLKENSLAKLAEKIDPSPFFYFDYLKYGDDEEFWKQSCTPAPLENVTIPALHICGWYDLSTSGVLDSFVQMKARGGSQLARTNQKLVMGPWVHNADFPSVSGELDFGMASSGAIVDICGLHIRWFDYWLKGIDNGVMSEPPVRIFIMGDNIWRNENEWPLARTQYTKYYFHSDGKANSRNGDGGLSDQGPDEEPTDNFLYDPRNPVPAKPGSVGSGIIMGAIDFQDVEKRVDVLVYSSEILKSDLEVTGPIKLILYAATSAVDTDFTGKLVDVWPDGRSYNLVDGIIRACYRASEWEAKPIVPGKIYEYCIDLGATSIIFKAGHRIRVEVSSSSFPKWDRNLNTGHRIGQDAEMKVALQTIYHDRQYSSHVILPIIPK